MSRTSEAVTGSKSADKADVNSQLNRVLGGGFAIAASVGTVIGMGILRVPGEIAAVFSNPVVYLGLWIVVGLFVLLNISVAAELVGITPRSGGYYVLVRRGLGPYPGFLMGWIDWISFPATIALKTTVLTEYLILLIPALQSWNKPLAVAITSCFAALQIRGVVLAATIQQIAAAVMSLILLSITLALLLAEPVTVNSQAVLAASPPGLKEYGLVLAAIVFTYDGWLSAAYFGGEIKGGGGAVARSCVRAVLIILVLYVGLNAVLAFTVPLSQLAGQELALAHALDITWGAGTGTFVLIAAVFILMAHQNGNYMTAPRTLHALSVDGFGLGKAKRVNKRGNPIFAVLLTWVVAVGLILAGGFEYLLNLSAMFYIVLYVAVMFGVFLLRRKEPETERPYRAWGHPYTTVSCIIGWTLITGFMAYTAPMSALSALLMTGASVPVYLVLAKLRGTSSA
jgi:APA family basic amino acid/polyamine antiporter